MDLQKEVNQYWNDRLLNLLTPNKETVVTKFEKLGQVLTSMANLVTPTNGGNNDDYVSHESTTVAMELAYRTGRALSLYRAIAKEQD